MAPLLRVNNLRTSFFTSDGEVRAVDGVNLDIEDGKTVGLVGESGCNFCPRAPAASSAAKFNFREGIWRASRGIRCAASAAMRSR
jgi:ABC-type antimicrobial peptide transport system ATPase subunit